MKLSFQVNAATIKVGYPHYLWDEVEFSARYQAVSVGIFAMSVNENGISYSNHALTKCIDLDWKAQLLFFET